VFEKRNTIFLLLTRGVNVCKKMGDVMAADQRHDASVVKAVHCSLLFVAICCFVQCFALINGFVWNCDMPLPGCPFTCSFDLASNHVNLSLGNEIYGVVEWGTAACQASMTMVEISVSSDMKIATLA